MLALLDAASRRATDATLLELAAHLKKKAKVEVHLSTVCRTLQKLGLPRTKKALPLPKESKPTGRLFVAESRAWIVAVLSLPTKQAFIWP